MEYPVTSKIKLSIGEIEFRLFKRKDIKAIAAAQKAGDEEALDAVFESCVISGKESLDDLILGEWKQLCSQIAKVSSEYVSKN